MLGAVISKGGLWAAMLGSAVVWALAEWQRLQEVRQQEDAVQELKKLRRLAVAAAKREQRVRQQDVAAWADHLNEQQSKSTASFSALELPSRNTSSTMLLDTPQALSHYNSQDALPCNSKADVPGSKPGLVNVRSKPPRPATRKLSKPVMNAPAVQWRCIVKAEDAGSLLQLGNSSSGRDADSASESDLKANEHASPPGSHTSHISHWNDGSELNPQQCAEEQPINTTTTSKLSRTEATVAAPTKTTVPAQVPTRPKVSAVAIEADTKDVAVAAVVTDTNKVAAADTALQRAPNSTTETPVGTAPETPVTTAPVAPQLKRSSSLNPWAQPWTPAAVSQPQICVGTAEDGPRGSKENREVVQAGTGMALTAAALGQLQLEQAGEQGSDPDEAALVMPNGEIVTADKIDQAVQMAEADLHLAYPRNPYSPAPNTLVTRAKQNLKHTNKACQVVAEKSSHKRRNLVGRKEDNKWVAPPTLEEQALSRYRLMAKTEEQERQAAMVTTPASQLPLTRTSKVLHQPDLTPMDARYKRALIGDEKDLMRTIVDALDQNKKVFQRREIGDRTIYTWIAG